MPSLDQTPVINRPYPPYKYKVLDIEQLRRRAQELATAPEWPEPDVIHHSDSGYGSGGGSNLREDPELLDVRPWNGGQ